MSVNYDECLDQNPFFQAIQENHNDIIKKATEEDWIICVPRIGTIEPATISTEDILENVLVPNRELPDTHFYTLTKREVIVQDKLVRVKGDEPIDILFDETFYIDKSQKYKLWCIERPLHQCLSNHETYSSIRNVHDCIKLLWATSCSSLDDINKIIEKFLLDECEFDNLEILEDKISVLYANCLEVISKSHKIRTDKDNIVLAVETYMQHYIHHKLFQAVCNCTWQVDARFNKTHRNFADIQLSDLEISNKFSERISSAKRELGSLNKFSTALGKVECLRRTVNTLNQKSQTQTSFVTTDDLLKIFVFLIVKCNLSNWIGNLMYITHFRFSTLNLSDENSFLITTLEAAMEFIKSGALLQPKISRHQHIKNLSNFFACVKEGNLDVIKKAFDSKTKNILNVVDKIPLCHPLCSCDKCKSVAPFSINSRDDKGCTALHVACLHGQPHVVEYLISKGVEIDVPDHSESMPLHYAALKGNQNALLLLLHSNAQIDSKDCDGNTPLHLAANNGHDNCIKALLYFTEQKGCYVDVNARNNMGNTALHFAVKWGYAGIVHILLQYGGNVSAMNKRNQKVFDVAHNDYLRKLLSEDVENKSLQNVSVDLNQTKKGASAEDVGVRPKNLEQMKRTDLALKSIENNDLPLMCYYLGIPTPPSTTTLDTKLTCHPLCTCTNCSKQFQLEIATIPSGECSEALNVNTCNSEGYSALHVAAKSGRTDFLRLLLDSGALINIKTYKNRSTPLHLACKSQRIAIVRELLKCGGCDLDIQDAKGNSPLHYACLSNDSRLVELLLSHGSDCNIKNNEGKSPVQEAKGRMLYNIVTLLKGKYESSDSSDSFESPCDLFSF